MRKMRTVPPYLPAPVVSAMTKAELAAVAKFNENVEAANNAYTALIARADAFKAFIEKTVEGGDADLVEKEIAAIGADARKVFKLNLAILPMWREIETSHAAAVTRSMDAAIQRREELMAKKLTKLSDVLPGKAEAFYRGQLAGDPELMAAAQEIERHRGMGDFTRANAERHEDFRRAFFKMYDVKLTSIGL